MSDTAAFRDDLALFSEALAAADREESGSARRKGRKPAPPHLRTEPFSLRLTASERALVHRAALVAQPGTAASTWARVALVIAARQLLESEGLATGT